MQTVEGRAQRILAHAREFARSFPCSSDLERMPFNPQTGIVTTAFPTFQDQEEWRRSPQCGQLRAMLSSLAEREGRCGPGGCGEGMSL
jgi:hypothetical protein